MSKYLKNGRWLVIVIAFLISFAEYNWVISTTVTISIQTVKLTEIFALTAITFLYLALLAEPFCNTFKHFTFKKKYLEMRGGLVIATFYFGLLHASFAFFGELGGFPGLSFLNSKFLTAITFSFTALIILFLLVLSSSDIISLKFKFLKWKILPKLLYVAGIFVLIHALMLGTDFANLSGNIPMILYLAISFLFLLEAPNIDKFLGKFINIPKFGLSFVLLSIILGVVFFTVITPVFSTTNGSVSFDIHAAHRQLAKEAAQDSSNQTDLSKITGLNGDRTRRFTVSMSTVPLSIQSNDNTTIHFKVYDASSGNSVSSYQLLYTRFMHLVIVNNDLTYFNHIHPSFENGEFIITTQFPKDDIYHLYISFQPLGAIEQQVGFNLSVGDVQKTASSEAQPDSDKAKVFGAYKVTITTKDHLEAASMSQGLQKISFALNDAKTGKPVTNLKPYLGSFGHLTLINEKTFEFIHVHPYSSTILSPDAVGGPTVDFLPIGIYGPFKSGVYRAFAEFNPGDNLITSDFTIKIN